MLVAGTGSPPSERPVAGLSPAPKWTMVAAWARERHQVTTAFRKAISRRGAPP